MRPTSYQVPAGNACVEQEIKRSRFIAAVGRAVNQQAAHTFIEKARSTHPDARHHCWAYVAGNPFNTVQVGMSDDGEPQGTAGKPMLSVLRYSEIGEIVAVVTRYFGGIKLGTGGLVRAYSGSLQMALQKLPLKKFVAVATARVTLPYPYENAVRLLLEKMKIGITAVNYTDRVILTIEVPENQTKELAQQIVDQTHGDMQINWLTESIGD